MDRSQIDSTVARLVAEIFDQEVENIREDMSLLDDLDAEFERIKALGAEVLIAPRDVSAGFGTRRIAFFRSPNGFVFEIMQVYEAKL